MAASEYQVTESKGGNATGPGVARETEKDGKMKVYPEKLMKTKSRKIENWKNCAEPGMFMKTQIVSDGRLGC